MKHASVLFCLLIILTGFSTRFEKLRQDLQIENFVEYKTPPSGAFPPLAPPPLPAAPEQEGVPKHVPCKTDVQVPFQLSNPSKCFDCERQLLGTDYIYLAKPGKCFDCENQIIDTLGPSYAIYGQSTKCFNCEKQPAGWGKYPGIM